MGGWLLLNNFGWDFYTRSAGEAYLIRSLCDASFQDKVLISIEVNWTWNKDGKIEFEEEVNHAEEGKRTYVFMMSDTLPDLHTLGFTDNEIQTLLVDNPRKFFAQAGKG